ncbi:MAG TPA: hypothetical protein VGO86_02720 [Candidatus Dormibacteraeota bacterium]|jgi:hypothetical protein
MSKKDSAAATRRTPPRRRPRRGSGAPWLLPVGVGVAVIVAFVVILVLYARTGNERQTHAAAGATGQTIDGIQCQTAEQVVYHIHSHLAIFVNGQPGTVPMGIGIPNAQVENTSIGPFVTGGSCFHWLHSHATDGIIHVESPSQRQYTLGNYFDIWGEQLSPTRVGADTGTVIAYVNGERYTGDPREIPLTVHAVIQLDVGTDVAPRPYTFAQGL